MNLIIPLPLLILSLTFQYALAASSNLTRVVNRDFITGTSTLIQVSMSYQILTSLVTAKTGSLWTFRVLT